MESLFLSEQISHVIQLAVAPVFLLASISAAMNVLSLRLGRIIDRGRTLNEKEGKDAGQIEAIDNEQYQLSLRARLIHRAIALCTFSALFVSLVIVFLFIDVLFGLKMGILVTFLFILALVALILALLTFLREIKMSTLAFSFGAYSMGKKHKRNTQQPKP
jgi:hypothetical protein